MRALQVGLHYVALPMPTVAKMSPHSQVVHLESKNLIEILGIRKMVGLAECYILLLTIRKMSHNIVWVQAVAKTLVSVTVLDTGASQVNFQLSHNGSAAIFRLLYVVF